MFEQTCFEQTCFDNALAFITVAGAGSTYSSQLCGTVGFAVGALFSIAHRAGTVRFWKTPSAPLNVVVTGELSHTAELPLLYVSECLVP